MLNFFKKFFAEPEPEPITVVEYTSDGKRIIFRPYRGGDFILYSKEYDYEGMSRFDTIYVRTLKNGENIFYLQIGSDSSILHVKTRQQVEDYILKGTGGKIDTELKAKLDKFGLDILREDV